jgi:hypothetical protein
MVLASRGEPERRLESAAGSVVTGMHDFCEKMRDEGVRQRARERGEIKSLREARGNSTVSESTEADGEVLGLRLRICEFQQRFFQWGKRADREGEMGGL